MPRYQQAIVRDQHSLAFGLWRFALSGVCIVTVGIGVAVYLGADKIVSWVVPGFDDDSRAYAAQILKLLAPMILFCSLGALYQSILHAHRNFAFPALIPVGNNLILIFVLIVLVPSYGLVALGYGSVVGAALWLLLLPSVLRQLPSAQGALDMADLRDLLKALVPLIVLLGVDQVAGLVQKTLVSDLEVGSIAVLNYAARLEGLPVGVFAGALSAVMFPALVEVVARDDRQALKERFGFGIAAIAFFLIPSTAFLIAESELVVRVLLERGSFAAEATARTARALELYSIGLLSQGLIVFLNRFYFALGNTRTPMIIGVITAALHVIFCWGAVNAIGYLGIAIGTTFYAIAYFVILIVGLRPAIPNPIRLLAISIWRPVVGSCVICWIMYAYDFPHSLIGLGALMVTCMAVYMMIAILLKDPVIEDLKFRFGKFLG